MKHPTPTVLAPPPCRPGRRRLAAAPLTAALLGLWHSRRQIALLDGLCTAWWTGRPP